MKLLLDTRWYSRNPSGVGHHVYHLMLGLIQHPEIQATFLGSTDGKPLPENISYIPLEGKKKKLYQGLWKTIAWPKAEWLTGKFDLAHYPNATAIPQRHGKYIVTVHDLAFLTYPETIEKKNLAFLQKWVKPSLEKASHIIAVSDATKNALVEHFKINPLKITRIYNGVDEYFFDEVMIEEKNEMKKVYKLDKPYFLSISTLEPRKDFLTQIRAYKLLPKSIRSKYDLVIAGGTGWKYKDILKEMNQKLDTGTIRYLGYIENIHKKALLQEASIYLHTSLDEGFGIGIVEALASKVPVIATNTSCHPEILQKFGYYVPIENPEALASKIEEILESKNDTMIAAGYKHAESFSWQKMEDETVKLYKKLLKE